MLVLLVPTTKHFCLAKVFYCHSINLNENRALYVRALSQSLVVDYGTDTFAFMHKIEGFVDVFQRHSVRDELL